MRRLVGKAGGRGGMLALGGALAVALLAWQVASLRRRAMMSDQQAPSQIEVGANIQDGDLRLWRAKEAVRQGELRLAAQAAIRTALEARATAITGWAAASLLALAAATAAVTGVAPRAGTATAGAVLFVAAGMCIHVARPRDWAQAGYDPTVITGDTLGTELEVLESVAEGISPGIQRNNIRLEEMGKLLRWSGWLLIAAPILGAAAYTVARAAT